MVNAHGKRAGNLPEPIRRRWLDPPVPLACREKCNRYCTECEYEEFLLQSVSYFTLAVPHRPHVLAMEAIMPGSTRDWPSERRLLLEWRLVGSAPPAPRSTCRNRTKSPSRRRTRSSVIVTSSGDTFFRKGAIGASDYLRSDQHPPGASQPRGGVGRGCLKHFLLSAHDRAALSLVGRRWSAPNH